MSDYQDKLVTDANVQEYFNDALQSALSHQKVPACEETIVYITHLLSNFLYTDRLYDNTSDGVMLRSLTELYSDAASAGSNEEKVRALKRLGDVSLFVSGLYANSLSRSLVDVGYYITMGGNAYGSIAEARSSHLNNHTMKEVFSELAYKFSDFVDVLSEVGEQNNLNSNNDVLRLYEMWLSSGSKRAEEKLRAQGIYPLQIKQFKH